MAASSQQRVVIVGGGVIGLTAAVALLERSPEIAVTVLEKHQVGEGATSYGGTLDIPFCPTQAHRQLVELSWAWHEARSATASDYRRPIDISWLAEPGTAVERLRRAVVGPLDPGRSALAPKWRLPAGVGQLTGRAYVLDAMAWVRSLAAEIDRSPRGRVRQQSAVVAIDQLAAGTAVKCANGEAFEAEHVVLCLGPWLPGWHESTRHWAGAHDLRTKRVVGLNISLDPDYRAFAAAGWPSKDCHFHPILDGSEYRLSFRDTTWDVDPEQPGSIAEVDLEPGRHFLDQLLGDGNWSITGHRLLADTYSGSFTPIVDRGSALGPNVTIASGTHGSGLRLAPGIADLVAREVLSDLGLPPRRRRTPEQGTTQTFNRPRPAPSPVVEVEESR